MVLKTYIFITYTYISDMTYNFSRVQDFRSFEDSTYKLLCIMVLKTYIFITYTYISDMTYNFSRVQYFRSFEDSKVMFQVLEIAQENSYDTIFMKLLANLFLFYYVSTFVFVCFVFFSSFSSFTSHTTVLLRLFFSRKL